MLSRTTILVAVDYSTHADAAVQRGHALAQPLGARLLIAHVIPGPAAERDPSNLWGSGEDATQRERDRLAAHVAALVGDAGTAEFVALHGDAAAALVTFANEQECSFLFLGRRGTTPRNEDRLGDVAQRIIATAARPVVVCGPAAVASPAASAAPAAQMNAASVMRPTPVTIAQGDSLAQAERVMQQHGVHQLPVVEAGRLIGILSRHDLATQAGYLERSKVDAVMTQSPVTVGPETSLADVAAMLIEEDINALPVVANGQLLGMVSKTDLLQQFRRMLAT